MHVATSAKWMSLRCMFFFTFVNVVLEYEEDVPLNKPQFFTTRIQALMIYR